jgi:hypothetical protein
MKNFGPALLLDFSGRILDSLAQLPLYLVYRESLIHATCAVAQFEETSGYTAAAASPASRIAHHWGFDNLDILMLSVSGVTYLWHGANWTSSHSGETITRDVSRHVVW